MGKIRKPFQGVLNIIRFNWHFYVIAACVLIAALLFVCTIDTAANSYIVVFITLLVLSTLLSLLASLYIYDFSDLYELKWIRKNEKDAFIVNINAGFDETSALLNVLFANAELKVLDFYNPEKHTEVSIKRARKAYPPYIGTETIEAIDLKLPSNSADKIIVTLAAHEIRNVEERILFFKELQRIIKPEGEIYVTEHLRDLPNFLVYTIGFLHFYSKQNWLNLFQHSNLIVQEEVKNTPFISTFILIKK